LAGGLVSLALAAAVAHEWQYTRMELALLNAMAKQTPQSEQALIDICQQIPDTAPLLKPYIPVVFTLTGHPENPAMREQLLVLAEAAVRFTPTQSLVYRLALLQALNDDKANARQTIDKALAAYPSGAIAFAQELLRIQAYAGPRIDVLMARLLPVVNPQLQANLPAGLKAKVKQATSQ
ncbi:Wzy polymerase domain-containing protein, partial [Methylomonas rivi]